MRFEINLATHPYEDARSFYWRAAIAGGLAAALAVVLALLLAQQVRSTSQLRNQLDTVNRELDGLNQQDQQARAILNEPQNQGTREQAQFLNTLLARRAFSWTEVFTDMEKLMPDRVHVASIRPELNDQNQLVMKITIAGSSRDQAIQLVRNLETSSHFRNPRLLDEKTRQAQVNDPDTIEFQLSAEYVPEFAPDEKGSEEAEKR